jgi:hypothetical protein
MSDRIEAMNHAKLRQAASLGALKLDSLAADRVAQIKRGETTLMAEIVAEMDNETGKPLHSNTEKREVAFNCRVGLDRQLLAAKQQLANDQYAAASSKIDAQYHSDMIRVLCAFAEAQKGWEVAK